MLSTAQELDLLCLLKKDDRTAFDAIYRHYFHAIYQNALKVTHEVIMAEDIVQEVFIALWEERKNIDINRSIGGWLFVVCYNKSINQLRKKLQESASQQRWQSCYIESTFIDENQYKQQWQLLQKAVSQLSPQKRKVFELCKLQGKTYEEAAAILHISKHTVNEYLSAAVCFVKEQVKHQPESTIAVYLAWLVYLFT